MKPTNHPERGRRRIIFAVASLLVAALVLCPAVRVYAAVDGASFPEARAESWLTQASVLWTDFWTAVTDLLPTNIEGATTADATSDPPTDTTGDGGFDPGGDGGLLDPNGGFGI